MPVESVKFICKGSMYEFCDTQSTVSTAYWSVL